MKQVQKDTGCNLLKIRSQIISLERFIFRTNGPVEIEMIDSGKLGADQA